MIFFLFACIVLVTVGILLRVYNNSTNKTLVSRFVKANKTVNLGTFKCSVNKNLWSPSNLNFNFNSVTLIKIENGILISPALKSTLFTSQRKPFVVGNKPLFYNDINVNKIEQIIQNDDSTIIKITARHNTSLEITIFGAEEVFAKMSQDK